MSRNEIVNSLIDAGVVAVIRLSDASKLIKVAEAINKGGVSAIEITMTVPNAIKVIEETSKAIGDFINMLRGKTFKGFNVAYFIDPITGKKVYISIQLTPE